MREKDIMGGSVFGSTVHAIELECQFGSLVHEVSEKLAMGALSPRPGRTKVQWGTGWRVRNWRVRKVMTYRSMYGKWLMIADNRGVGAFDYRNLLFVSSEGKIGYAVGQSLTDYYLNVFDTMSGENEEEISRWIDGMRFILGYARDADAPSHFILNPF